MNKAEKNLKKLKNGKKQIKNAKKKEELPSFLQNLSNFEFERKPKRHRELLFSSPVFFGECKQLHPIFHPINFSGHFQPLYTGVSEESVRSNLFIPKQIIKEKPHKIKKIRRPKRPKPPCVDTTPHHSPGVRKTFFPDISVFTPDLGQTTSVIEGETFREIPYRKIKNTVSGISQVEAESVMLSDIKEKRRDLLPYEQRMAHNHFPKEFITVKLIGPVIPASITITKMPSKRKRFSEFNFETEKRIMTKEPDRRQRKSKDIREPQMKASKEKSEKFNETSTDREGESEVKGREDAEKEETEPEKYNEAEEMLGEEEAQTPDEMAIDEEEYQEEELGQNQEYDEWEGEEEEAMLANEGENIEGDKGE